MPAYLNLNLRAWRQIRRAWDLPRNGSLRFQTYVLGSMRSLAAALQLLVMLARGAPPPKEGAIVILGFWRSGTTLLHELLCVDDRFTFPTTYACLNPHHFVFTQVHALAKFSGKVKRVQDKMTIGLASPQEDEFALLCLGARSPYEALLAPRKFAQTFALADPDDLTPEESRYWHKTFLKFFRGVSFISGGKPLVLKSPAHSYRVAVLRKLLPDARFILIVRDPYEVFESMVRAYRALTQKFGVGPAMSDDELRSATLSERKRFEAKLHSGVAGLPEHRFAVVRYEQLVQNPLQVIEGLYRHLELANFEDVRPKLAAEIAGRSDYVQDAVRPDPVWQRQIGEQWREIFERYGYSLGDVSN
jgi:hypothetical protein